MACRQFAPCTMNRITREYHFGIQVSRKSVRMETNQIDIKFTLSAIFSLGSNMCKCGEYVCLPLSLLISFFHCVSWKSHRAIQLYLHITHTHKHALHMQHTYPWPNVMKCKRTDFDHAHIVNILHISHTRWFASVYLSLSLSLSVQLLHCSRKSLLCRCCRRCSIFILIVMHSSSNSKQKHHQHSHLARHESNHFFDRVPVVRVLAYALHNVLRLTQPIDLVNVSAEE